MRIAQAVAYVSAATFGIWGSVAPAKADLRDRVAAAVETVQKHCGDDINAFCGNVTRGEGRVLLCMQAHDDQLSRSCQFALYRVSRRLDNALNRVERTADACWSDIQAKCGDADRIGQCLQENRSSLSDACQSTIDAVQRVVHGVLGLRGMQVESADNKGIGHIVDIERGSDGQIESVKIEVGQFLGLGSKVVTISGDKLQQLGEKIQLRLSGDQLRSLPDAK
jgi:hypothetical protein